MDKDLHIFNTLSRKKEKFEPLNPPHVGIYVCGPTVYGDAHLGHARPAITFDLLFRYLKHLGFTVRYVRNITDVGHLENDADEGEDKIGKKARLEQLEPMEVVQYYTNRYHVAMQQLNVLSPSIEPTATGHIIEQIAIIDKILKTTSFAYIKNGSVYFDVKKFFKVNEYGSLSGKKLFEQYQNTRELEGQDEKKSNYDFALWKKAGPEHIMHWPSKWSEGFPGWHLECTAMSNKYLGEKFDIHGGGMDLQFPHHECEIAQSIAAFAEEPARYWMHNNMITINGQKMGKSLGNFITLQDLFSGNNQLLEQAYSPMTIRFFILQAHYRSTLDFSNEALQAAGKGFQRLMTAYKTLQSLKSTKESGANVNSIEKECYNAINDDLNTAQLISVLMESVRLINSINDGKESIDEINLAKLKTIYKIFIEDILGLKDESAKENNNTLISGLVNLMLELRVKAKKEKDFATSDAIRNELIKLGVEIKDTISGYEWSIK